MARDISISFSLTAALTGGFKGAFQSAASSARNVASAIREMEKTPVGQLGASMAKQREKIKGLAGSAREARATLASLQAQAANAGSANKLLATQIEQAQSRVNNLNGALARQRNLLLNTAAQAATSGKSIRQLGQEYNSLTQNIERAKKAQAAMAANRAQGDALRTQRADLNSRLAGAMGAAATVAIPAKLSIDFEQAIANVGAVSNASDENLKRLTDTARQLGRDTMFSASQAAEGMKYLAMAGFNTEQTIAAMPGLLDLAAASSTDLGTTSDIASDILTAFNMKASEMGKVGDILTRAFTNSNTDLTMLGETMKYVAPVAASLGMTLDQTAAYAGAMASAGIKASQGGTVLRAAMLRLAAPPKASKDALKKLTGLEGDDLDKLSEELDAGAEQLEKLGMTTKDSAGNMRPLVDILEELNVRTKDMGNAEKTEVFKNVFGTEASAGMINLAAMANKTIDDTGKQIVDASGNATSALRKMLETTTDEKITAAKVAQKQMDTTQGSLKSLGSAWEGVGISVGNLFLPCIRAAAGALSGIANVISGVVNRFPTLSKGIALVVGGVLAFTAASVGIGLVMNLVRTSLNVFRGGLLRLSAAHLTATVSTTASTAAAGGFGIASRIAGAGAKFFAGGLRSILLASGVGALLVGLGFGINLLIDNWDAVVNAMSAAWGWVTGTWGRITTFFSTLGSNLAGIWPGIWSNVCQVASDAKASFISIWEDVSGFFSGLWQGIISGATSIGQGILHIFSTAKDSVIGVWDGITGFFSTLWGWLADGATNLWDNVCALAAWSFDGVIGVWNGAVEFFSALVSNIAAVFAWAHDGIIGIWQGVTEFFGSIVQGISECFSGVWQGIVGMAAGAWEGIAGIWNGAIDFFSGIVDGIIGVFQPAFDWLKEKFAWVLGAVDTVKSAVSSITGAVKGAWNAAFGDGEKKESGEKTAAANGEKAAATVNKPSAAPAANGQKAVSAAPPQPERKPSAASNAENAQKTEAGKGKTPFVGREWKPGAAPEPPKEKATRKKAVGGRGARASSGSGAKSDSGPVTVVTLDSGNEIRTQFFPAATRNAAGNAVSAQPPAAQRPLWRDAPMAGAAGQPRAYSSQQDTGFFASAVSALKTSGIGGVIGQGLQAGIGMAKSVFGIGQPQQDSLVMQAAKAQDVKPVVLSADPSRWAPSQAIKMASSPTVPGQIRNASALQTAGQPALPQAPAMIAKRERQKPAQAQSNQQSISIDLTQNFDLITQDAAAARKVLEAIRPDMEALIRRALAKIQSDKTRTAYAQ